MADYVRRRPGLDARIERDAESATPRQTPAFEEFTASNDPVAVYMRTREFLAYGAAANQYDITMALESVSQTMPRRSSSTGAGSYPAT